MRRFQTRHAALFLFCLLLAVSLRADPIPVRHPQGSTHGFLVLKTLEGKRIATGDVTQSVQGDRVTANFIMRFRDGSVDEETTVFSQRGFFHLIRDHHIQRGPSFPKPIDIDIDANTGQVTFRDQDGKLSQEHLDLPADVANGLPPNLLLNVLPSTPETKVSYVASMPKPRLITVSIKPGARVPFTVGGTARKAIDYVVHVELGGVTGMLAPLIGKQPGDYHFWILPGSSPAFIREEGQFYEGGPVWRIEQVSPTFQ